MGQLLDLHARMLNLLAEIKAASDGPVRVYVDPPTTLPEMPCVFLLTPDEQFDYVDINTGRSLMTVVVRCCVDATKPQTALLALADTIADTTDIWLRNDHPSPIDQARRIGMRGVTPMFGDIPTRGADFPISLELEFRPITPAP
jgi:hypothetical protein